MKTFLISSILGQISHNNLRNFNQEDILREHRIYKHLDPNKTIVAGSYALKQFTGDLWDFGDIDIVVNVNTITEFQEYINQFCQDTKSECGDIKDFSNLNDFDVNDVNNIRDEKFHELIKGSCKVNHPSLNKTLQFVWIKDPLDPSRSSQSILAETSDLPSCVSYTFDNNTNQKIFHIPEKGREALFWRTTSVSNVCKSRKEKYESRGYYYQ